jgi:hypothetical protein
MRPPKIGLWLGPALWAGVAAQDLKDHQVGPALSTIDHVCLGPGFLESCLVPPIVRNPFGIL